MPLSDDLRDPARFEETENGWDIKASGGQDEGRQALNAFVSVDSEDVLATGTRTGLLQQISRSHELMHGYFWPAHIITQEIRRVSGMHVTGVAFDDYG